MGWLRSPLLHFLALGAAAQLLLPAGPPVLHIPESRLRAVAEDWQRATGREPGAEQRAAIREQAIDEAVLFAEAEAAGILERDPVVQRRLAKVGAFVDPEGAAGGDEAAIRAARNLGLDRSDVVVRRYATTMMRLALEGAAPGAEPDEQALEEALAARADRYRLPEHLELTHVFVSRERGDAQARAQGILARLRGRGGEAGGGLGDAFAHGPHASGSRQALGRVFGETFPGELDPGAVGRWQGPVPSAYGLHLVYLRSRTPERLPALAEVRARVRADLLRERRDAHLHQQLRELRGRYAIELPASALDGGDGA